MLDDRYHLVILRTPSQTRHALCYVLQNARRHGDRVDPRYGGADPFSSAWWFDGWKDAWRIGIPPPDVRTVAPAESWLLTTGWKRSRLGLISITEVPPAGRQTSRPLARVTRPRRLAVVPSRRSASHPRART